MMNLTRQKGLSLVELLVAMALGVFLMSQVIQVMMNGKKTFLLEQELSQIQENARFAVEFISRDLRMAGYTGCVNTGGTSAANIANSVNSTTMDFTLGLQGFEHEAGTSTFPGSAENSSVRSNVLPNTDAIRIGRGDSDNEFNVSYHVPSSATIHLTRTHDMKKGDILVIADETCSQMGILQQTNTNNNNTVSVVGHNPGGGANCDKALKGNYTCSSGTPVSGAYGPGSKMFRYINNTYYIRESVVGGGIPALWREPVGGIDEELVQGVENFQLSYGMDTDADGIANQYLKANQVTGGLNWEDVVSVRIALLMRSINPVLEAAEDQAKFEKITIAKDRFLRQQVTTTIQIRNRGLL